MTLEDFFTLTEMKDGLTTLTRVEELVAVMQKEKDIVLKNVGDASRQWSTVASTLAATIDKDCLNHFIQLDGLLFLNRWLREAQSSINDTSDNFVEESIKALLGALEKLPIDNEKLTTTGIRVTVEHLLGHKSIKVQERARSLLDSWNQASDKDSIQWDREKGGACCEDELKSANVKLTAEGEGSKHPVPNVYPFKGSGGEVNVAEPARSESQHSSTTSADDSQMVISKDVKNPTSNQDAASLNTSTRPDVNGFRGDALGSSLGSSSCQESLSITEESSICPTEGVTSNGTCSSFHQGKTISLSIIPREKNVDDGSSYVSELKASSDGVKEAVVNMNMKEDIPHKSTKKEKSSVCTPSGHECVSLSAHPADAQKPAMESAVSCDKGNESCLKETAPAGLVTDTGLLEPQPKSGAVDCEVAKHSRSAMELKYVGQAGECYSKAVQDLSYNGCIPGKTECPENSFSRKPDTVKPMMDTIKLDEINRRKPDMELEYGLDDPLEVARQVAKEVEREVVDYREPFCSSSSSEKNSGGEIMQPSSPDSVKGEQDQLVTQQLNENEMPTMQDPLSSGSSPDRQALQISSKGDAESKDTMHDMESPQLTAVAQESVSDIDKSRCDFDLNENVYDEEIECRMIPNSNQPQINLSAPIRVIAASKGSPGLPTTPLHFEGELGWRGSAATSAFRPASPRRTPDGGKAFSVEASGQCSKQRMNFLEIDLNVADGNDDNAAIDQVSAKDIPFSSGLPSGDSSIEVSSRRAERLNLDLNRLGDNEDASTYPSSDLRVEGQFHHRAIGNRSPSPASSSSRQPSMRDFDLNDHPFFLDVCGSRDNHHNLDKSSSQYMNGHGSLTPNDPLMSIMGSRIDVNRKEIASGSRTFLANMQGAEFSMGVNLARVGVNAGSRPELAYSPAPSHTFGYNGYTMGSAISLPPPLFGPGSGSYMVDARGTFMPQVLTSSLRTTSSSRPHFLTDVTYPPSSLSGTGLSQLGLDLNSGMPKEFENGEVGILRQPSIQGHGGLMVEPLRHTTQPSGSGMGLKRKEPDNSWDLFPVNYKQATSWH